MISFIKSLLSYGTLVLIGISLSVILLEIGLRFLGAKPETYLRKFSQYHPVLGWVKTPHEEGVFIRGDTKISEKMNSKGLRDIEYEYSKPAKTIRILILGDSFTEGYDVDFEHLFTEILEKKLNESFSSKYGVRYEVINAGTGGYSTDQEYLFFLNEGYKYEPDVAIMMTYAPNDIMYNIESMYGNYYKPLFVVEADTLRLTNAPLPKIKEHESIKNVFRDLALYPIVVRITLTQFPSIAQKLSQWGFISKSTLEVTTPQNQKFPFSFSIFSRDKNDDVEKAWKVTELLIRGSDRVSKSVGGAFLLCSIPDRFQIYHDKWINTQTQYGVNDLTWDLDLPDSRLKAITHKYNIPFLDLKTFFYSQYAHENLYNGVHWNRKGNEATAEFLYNELIHRNLIGTIRK